MQRRGERKLLTSDASNSESKQFKFKPIWAVGIVAVLGVVFLLVFTVYLYKKSAREKKILRALANSPEKSPLPVPKITEEKVEENGDREKQSELVFFVGEEEQFTMDELLEATADLRKQGVASSLYKVVMKGKYVFAVKRLKKIKASFHKFGQTMRKIGNLNHPNILPLVGYYSATEEKLLIYRYQNNGSLLTLLEGYVEGKRTFPGKQRLTIAMGIARGLDFIYRMSDEESDNIVPHGNIKLSNILVNENEEPLVSEFGYMKFLEPSTASLFDSNGYTAPEKKLTEQADVYSFGVVLLELLTGKIVEKSGLDLPKWVKSMVREEWTGEVFDKEVGRFEAFAFPMLNIALKCVERKADDRPSIAEVLDKIEEIVNVVEDISPLSATSYESTPP
nr:probable inactive receptor kinase At4g23740 [Ipomoea batatas]